MSEKQIKKNHKVGRPSVMTDAVKDKLLYAYSIGCSTKEAALYADISTDTLYKYFKKDPAFADKCDLLKNKPVLKARIASNKLIEDGDPVHIRWYLEHKKADEFNTRQQLEIDAAGSLTIEDRAAALDGFLSRFIE